MTHYDPQLDCFSQHNSSSLGTREPRSRQLSTWQLCWLVLAVLALHWIGMQFFVSWLGGEGALARAQTVSSSSTVHTVPTVPDDDGWRRTSHGWEYKMNDSVRHTSGQTIPTHHISPYQFWPAAAAACMLLLITGLPDWKSNKD